MIKRFGSILIVGLSLLVGLHVQAANIQEEARLNYQSHVAKVGWQKNMSQNELSGTIGKSLRMEAVKINVNKPKNVTGTILYRTHVEKLGWLPYVESKELSGTTGKSLQIEAIQIRLTGDLAKQYDVHYQAHIKNIGWTPYMSNNAVVGTTGRSLQMEALRVKLVKKNNNTEQPNHTEPNAEQPTTDTSAKMKPNVITKDCYVTQGTNWSYGDSFVSATDENGQILSLDRLEMKNNVDLNRPGKYSVTFYYTDGPAIHSFSAMVQVKPRIDANIVSSEMLKLVNDLRARNGSQPLTYSHKLNQAAEIRATEAAQLYSHTRPNNKGCFTVFTDNLGYSWNQYGQKGENIVGAQIAEDSQVLANTLFTSWYNSPAHRENMLCREYNEFGFGINVAENGRATAVQWFADSYSR